MVHGSMCTDTATDLGMKKLILNNHVGISAVLYCLMDGYPDIHTCLNWLMP